MEKHTMNIGNLMQYYRKKETDNINIKLCDGKLDAATKCTFQTL